MVQNRLNILHILGDYKFYDKSSRNFNNCIYYHNIYAYRETKINGNECQKFKESSNEVLIFRKFHEILNIIHKKKIDVVYFHSLIIPYWRWVSKLPHNIIIIWWVWGYEIYNKYGFIRPLIDIELYKAITKSYIESEEPNIYIRIGRYIKSIFFLFYRKRALKKISYLKTVTSIEFKLLQSNPLLSHVKRFYTPFSSIYENFHRDDNANMILVGNSASATNNHADVLRVLHISGIENRKVLIPMSYGSSNYASFLKECIKNNSYHFQVKILDTFLPINEYENIFRNISHAIFGVMRQQAMGNIIFCFLHGVKIFLYQDSILYKDLKELGFVIFSIDKELTKIQLESPLSKEDAINNYNKWVEYTKNNNIQMERTVKDLIQHIS